MLMHRVIPALLIHKGELYKTRKFKSPRYVGDPINAIKIFNEKEVDELIVIDIDASKNKADPDFDLIERLAGECFMPVCYGGGIKTVDQAKRIISLGIEKVSIQSAALKNLKIVRDLANTLGTQSVVVSVDVKKDWLGRYRVYDSTTGNFSNSGLIDHLKEAVKYGAGEILLNSVDRDGTRSGFDLDLIQLCSNSLSTPLIALGGANSIEDFAKATKAGANAIAAGSLFVFQKPHDAVLITYPKYSELENLFR